MPCALAQDAAAFQYLTKKNGLSQSSVFAIAQDSFGLMWFGTRDGLNQYDGYRIKIYRNGQAANDLIGNDIRTLYVDPKSKQMWVGTVTGLSLYRSRSDDFKNFTHLATDSSSISNDVIRAVYRDSKGRLWVCTRNGLNLFNANENSFSTFYLSGSSKYEEKNDIETILENNGQIWLGTKAGLYRLQETNGRFSFIKNMSVQLSSEHIKNLLVDEQGNFWIGTQEGGINYWNRSNNTITLYQQDEADPFALNHNNIRTMTLDPKGNLWVGTFAGLNYLDTDSGRFSKYKKRKPGMTGLSDYSVRSIYVDLRGSLWVGTYFGGVNYLDKDHGRFTNFKPNVYGNSLTGEVVSSFAENRNGNLWIGTEGGGLNFYNQSTKQFTNYRARNCEPNTLCGNHIKELLLDNNQLWIGTFRKGLNLFDLTTKQFQHFKHDPNNSNSLSDNNVYGLHKDGNYLWILTYGGGLNILDLITQKFYHYQYDADDENGMNTNLPRVFLETADGQLWIGTDEGLHKVIKNPAGLPERFEKHLTEEKIYALQQDRQQNIWVGTFSNGLYRFDPRSGAAEHFTTTDGLSGNTVFGILEAANGELWLSTNNGLSKYNIENNIFTNYHYSNGLENSEYNFNAYYKTRSGDLLFGGLNGFTRFNPNDIQTNQIVPALVFTELRQNNQPVEIHESGILNQHINATQQITFAHNTANFSISFAALDYFSPENNRYAYMLEGLDRDWNYTEGETQATYTIQRAGDYTFRLQGANSDGVWNPTERQIQITVLPPLWQTWWAYLIYLAIISAFVWAIIRFFRLRHKLQLQQVSKQQQEELHEVKLRFFTNITHEFRTPLTLILGPLKDLLTKETHTKKVTQQLVSINKSADRLLNLVNQILTFRRLATDHESMQLVTRDLIPFLEEIFLSFQETARLRNIDYQFHTSIKELVIPYDADKLEKVFFNLLSNAFKFTPDGGQIELSVSTREKEVVIKVKDSGIGIAPEFKNQIFKRFYEKQNMDSTIKGTGIGLAISKQMVELHQGSIFVTDSKQGATFVVQLPKGQVALEKENVVDDLLQTKQAFSQKILPSITTLPTPTDNKKIAAAEALPLLLIVEDNADIRNYIQQIFTGDYRIITAENGSEGLQKTRKQVPDLVISDVMMPVMDGITFCATLKSDLAISHIPVILLTARTASLFKMEGLRTGADDYITKPFEPDELRLRVHNIIQARQEVKNKFARVLTFDPKEITITSPDETFLKNALDIVERNIDRNEFNVEQFAADLAVSRPLLFTKLKALTGQTPNNFIKTIRLKRAAQLLKTQKLNVSQVAYKVGFKDPKYFRKCFKQQFAVSPSNYVTEENFQ
ncbi:MAG: two-component regulator propeller domain-containing protein [Saprospiraceae bacterium]